jgi:hypothetical protein
MPRGPHATICGCSGSRAGTCRTGLTSIKPSFGFSFSHYISERYGVSYARFSATSADGRHWPTDSDGSRPLSGIVGASRVGRCDGMSIMGIASRWRQPAGTLPCCTAAVSIQTPSIANSVGRSHCNAAAIPFSSVGTVRVGTRTACSAVDPPKTCRETTSRSG